VNWKRIIRWSFAAILVLLLASLAVGLFVLRSRSFHRYVLAKIVEKTQEATGGRVEIGDYTFHWSGLRADVYRLAIHGTEPDPAKPLLATDHLGVGLKIISALRRKVDLNEIVVDHPVVHLFVDKSGRTNIPQPQVPKKENKPLNIFDLAIKHFLLRSGEVYYNDRQLPLDAELHDLQAQLQFDALKTQYTGSLSYRHGRLQFSDFNPLEHDLEAGFSAAPSGLNLDRIIVATSSSRISAQASVKDYSNPAVQGTYQATISTEELRNILKQPSLPVGEVVMNGSAQFQNLADQSFMEGLFVDGHMSSSVLAIRLPEAHGEIRAVRGRYRLEKGTLEANDLRADLLGGHLTADLSMRHLASNPEAHVAGSVSAISLDAVNAALGSKPLEGVSISGRLDGKGEATWRGSLEDLTVRSDATIVAGAGRPSAGAAGSHEPPIPVNGTVHFDYDGTHNIMSLNQTYLQTPHTNIRLNGTVSVRSALKVEARNDDLHELDLLALSLRRATAASSSAPQLFGLSGSASLAGQMQGSIKAPRFMGQLTATNFQFQGFSGRVLRTGVNLSPSQAALQQGDLETSTQGRIKFDVAVGLRNWSYTPSNPVTANVSATKLPVADLERLAKLQYPVTGLLNANISMRGSRLNPAGKGSVQLTEARVWDQPVQSFALQFQGTGSSVHSTVAVRTPAGSATGNLTYYPKNEGYEGQIEARNIKLDQLQPVRSRDLEIKGNLTVSAKGSGTFKAPQLEATVEIPELEVREQKMSAIKARVNVADQKASFSLDSKVADVYIKSRGSVDLTPGYYATATLDTRGVQLGPFLARYLPGQAGDLRGQTELHGSLKGPLKDPVRLEAHVEIPSLSLGYQSIQIQNAAPIRLDYRGGVLILDQAKIKGTGTDLELQATVPLQGSGSINASAVGTLDLHLIQILYPDVDSAGQVKLDVTARGDRSHPSVQGQVRIINAAFQAPNAPLGMEKLNGEFAVQNNRVEIKELAAQTGGGSLSAQGYVAYQPEIRFQVGLTADSVRLRYPEGVRALLRGNLGLSGTPQSSDLSGEVVIERLSFTDSFDLATFTSQFTGESSAPPSRGFAQNLKLNVGLQSAQELGVASAKLSVQGSANLRVRGTAAEPVLLGRANLTGGELFFLGNRYQVENGVVDFANPVRTEPVLNLAVRTTVQQYNLNLNLVGPIERLRTTYTSEPPLPPVDIINLLAFGKTTEAAAASPSTPAGLGAERVLAQGLSSQVSGRVEKLAGLSQLSIDPLIGGNQRNPGARLAIQRRVTKNLLLTFATDVTSTEGQTVQVEYQFSRRWSASAVRDQNGGFAVDAKMHKTF
jgi:translocation and assembly module TamB